jgi:hypothetical protein
MTIRETRITELQFDLTAGERARAIARQPSGPVRIFDPTDPRCEAWLPLQTDEEPAAAAGTAGTARTGVHIGGPR